ncbi:OLC1v1002887C1 [Oldenlandia corymbosa var. corymbosa]|uniref:OLC1v1002887C1 n=1 Tax=Oldenlandia corymbosa var. corymbosa TaxID=529605 RepID=A0AAV1DA14_OLDCO|nr:OLC1v1002887C1 [Oldenlandia corymbosa var. corymbosa]
MEYYCMGNDSECSSGCESGWTLYLDDKSFVSALDNNHKDGFLGKGKCERRTEEEEEEDMSMVSDASSGPPHVPEEESYYGNDDTYKCFHHESVDAARLNSTKNRAKKQGLRENKRRNLHEKSSLLDDTASSPVFNFPNNNSRLSKNNHHASAEALLDVSKGYSTTQFEGSSAYHYYHQSQYGFVQYPSLSGNYQQQNQWFAGSRTWQQ